MIVPSRERCLKLGTVGRKLLSEALGREASGRRWKHGYVPCRFESIWLCSMNGVDWRNSHVPGAYLEGNASWRFLFPVKDKCELMWGSMMW